MESSARCIRRSLAKSPCSCTGSAGQSRDPAAHILCVHWLRTALSARCFLLRRGLLHDRAIHAATHLVIGPNPLSMENKGSEKTDVRQQRSPHSLRESRMRKRRGTSIVQIPRGLLQRYL